MGASGFFIAPLGGMSLRPFQPTMRKRKQRPLQNRPNTLRSSHGEKVLAAEYSFNDKKDINRRDTQGRTPCGYNGWKPS